MSPQFHALTIALDRAAAPLRALNSPSLHAVFITVDRAAAPLRAINPTLARIAARFPIVTIRGPSK